jgi:GNAT superfamily N-acetyltransferase
MLMLRRASDADVGFLRDMLFEAAHPDGRPRPVKHEWFAQTEMVAFVDQWARDGDVGVVAEREGIPVGAAWCRLFTQDEHLWGYVDPDTPELAIAVRDGSRRQGVGRALLERLLLEARAAGHARLSLSVDTANAPARRLYQSLGFRDLGSDAGGGRIMVVDTR